MPAHRIYRIPPGALRGSETGTSFSEAITQFRRLGCATEIHFNQPPPSDADIALAVATPGHSIHLPSGRQGDQGRLSLAVAGLLAPTGLKMVVHPNDIHHPDNWKPLAENLLLENMDSAKASGQTPEDLAPLFEALPEAGFCFDIAHAREVDPSLSLASELLDAFGHRLSQFHVSTVHPGGLHDTLTPEVLDDYLPFLHAHPRLPVVLEAYDEDIELLRWQICLLRAADADILPSPNPAGAGSVVH